jgi:hypothetical protein
VVHAQAVPITTKVVSSNSVHGEVYYMISVRFLRSLIVWSHYGRDRMVVSFTIESRSWRGIGDTTLCYKVY